MSDLERAILAWAKPRVIEQQQALTIAPGKYAQAIMDGVTPSIDIHDGSAIYRVRLTKRGPTLWKYDNGCKWVRV